MTGGSPGIARIIQAIAPMNNRYREARAPVEARLGALWDMGNQLQKLGVTSPHSAGWEIQRATKGLIKRPTVFRSHKVRTIWPSKAELRRDIGGIRSLSRLKEMLPLLDPGQSVRGRLSPDTLKRLYRCSCEDSPRAFADYVSVLKARFGGGRLGQPLDRSKHLEELGVVQVRVHAFLNRLQRLLGDANTDGRDAFRVHTSRAELVAFSNMCIALTTKDNLRLYRPLEPLCSNSADSDFRELYAYFRELLGSRSDVLRARLRRIISPEQLASLSDSVSSLRSEGSVQDYRSRRKLAIRL